MDEDVLWLDQQTIDTEDLDIPLFRRTIKEALARGWELLDARHYAYGHIVGRRLWAVSSPNRY